MFIQFNEKETYAESIKKRQILVKSNISGTLDTKK